MRFPESSLSAYPAFARKIKNERRYILDVGQQAFLANVLETSGSRKEILHNGKLLWRARIGFNGYALVQRKIVAALPPCPVQVQVPHNIDGMKPPRDRSKEGRVNAKGMPCLYCATDRDTAMNELRPWIGAQITVAEMMTLRDLTLVDCTADPSTIAYLVTSDDERLWMDINAAFSRPVTDSDDSADYAPTQVLAEAFRVHGFDGIKYRTKVGEGASIALFDLDAAKVVSRRVCEVKSRVLTFSEVGETVYESDHPAPKEQDWE